MVFKNIVVIDIWTNSLLLKWIAFHWLKRSAIFTKHMTQTNIIIHHGACVQNPVYESAVAGDRREEG